MSGGNIWFLSHFFKYGFDNFPFTPPPPLDTLQNPCQTSHQKLTHQQGSKHYRVTEQYGNMSESQVSVESPLHFSFSFSFFFLFGIHNREDSRYFLSYLGLPYGPKKTCKMSIFIEDLSTNTDRNPYSHYTTKKETEIRIKWDPFLPDREG